MNPIWNAALANLLAVATATADPTTLPATPPATPSARVSVATPRPAPTRFPEQVEIGLGERVPRNGPFLAVSKGSHRLLYFRDSVLVAKFPVATGRYWVSTPMGRFRITNKMRNPSWRLRGMSAQGGSPSNPLGTRWMALDCRHFKSGATIGIHGTDDEALIGWNSSRGCVRMHNEDVEWLYERVPVGTPVHIVK